MSKGRNNSKSVIPRVKSRHLQYVPTMCREFEKLLGEVVKAFNNATRAQYPDVVNKSLGRIARFLNFDRSAVMLFDSNREHLQISYGWVKKGDPASMIGRSVEEELPWYAGHIRSGHMLLLKTIGDLSPEAVKEREFLLREGIQSHLTIPLVADGFTIGAVAFGSFRLIHRWAPGIILRFRLFGEIITLALEKHKRGGPAAPIAGRTGNSGLTSRAMRPDPEHLRRLALHLIEAEHRERRRIAETLHENIMQTLAAARFVTGAAQRDSAYEAVARANELIRSALHDLHVLVMNLQPLSLYEIGLAAALQWLADRIKHMHGMDVVLDLNENAPEDEGLRPILYEAARQLLFNAAVHGGASRAVVMLRRSPKSCYQLTVTDNGSGFDTKQLEEIPSKFFGLFALREKARLFGGSLRITSALHRGTRATMTLPQTVA